SASINAYVEGFVNGHNHRDRVRNRFARYFLAVYREHAGATLAGARSIVLEVKDDGVLAGPERTEALPPEPLQIQEIVNEHRPAFAYAEQAGDKHGGHPEYG